MAMAKENLNANKRVLIYCRESRDDYMLHYDRIETQRDLLIKFCERNGYTNIIDIVLHNDMTGTDFARFDEITERIKNNEIDVLVMKDSSRLGRNQIESLKFVEMLAEHDVELVFEGKTYDEDFFPLEAWFNERRAKDDSRKIRTNLKHKMEEGRLIVRSHYGYIKEGIKENSRLIVDDNVSWVIKKIYKLYLEGYGYRAIATKLNEEQIPTPSQYDNNPNKPISDAWISQHVKRVLENEIYTGTMVSGTTEKVSFKSKKTRRKPEEEWIRVEDNHEAIISKEDFDEVQKLIKSKSKFAPKSKKPSPFAGMVECGRCNSSMYMIRRKNRPDAFVCGKYTKEGKINQKLRSGCTTHRLREDELEEIIKKHIENVLNNPEYRSHVYREFENIEFVRQNAENTIKSLEAKLEKLKNHYKAVYDDKLNGNIPDFIFKEKSKELQDNINIVEKQINSLKKETKELSTIDTNIDKIDNVFKQLLSGQITKQQISRIINKIIVFDKKEVTKEQKTMYNIDTDTYNEILENGGIIIVFAYNVHHVFTSRWITYLIGTQKLFDLDKYLKEVI